MKDNNRPLDPNDYVAIVGKTFADYDHTPLVSLGDRSWTRWQLGVMGVPHPSAAKLVDRVIQTLGIRTPGELARAVPEFRKYRRFGVTAYWVLLAIVHDAGGADMTKAHNDNRTFNSVHREVVGKKSVPTAGRRRR
jgi:hypothetical protein